MHSRQTDIQLTLRAASITIGQIYEICAIQPKSSVYFRFMYETDYSCQKPFFILLIDSSIIHSSF